VTNACDDETVDGGAPPPESSPDTTRTLVITGAVIGGAVALGGLVDLGASAMAGEEKERTYEKIERSDGEPYDCRIEPATSVSGAIRFGDQSMEFADDEAGRVRAELALLQLPSAGAWGSELRVEVDGATLSVGLDDLELESLARELDRSPQN
jgi:hypothetical protein